VISDEHRGGHQRQLVDHNSVRQRDGRGEEGGARHDALHGPSPPLCNEYGIRREEQAAYGVGREALPAERRGGVCVWTLRCKDF